MKRYNPKEIEPKWQAIWDKNQTYKADLNSTKPKYYAMSMLNYPSGSGIHIGHAMNYTISDVMARFKRQQGYESYHPVGWDAFGLPAENYAIKTGESPQASMAKIIPNYHKQYKAMAWSNDWSKEVSTHDPDYYKWTQWIFSEMYRQGLAYQDSRMQWWCAIDNTVLADEQVTADGKCWRHDGVADPVVEKKEIKQWFFRITDYADVLLDAIDELDWSQSVKLAQKNWIGRSVGAEISFELKGSKDKITVFTTRPDTIYGATFLVVAPEHEILNKLSALQEVTQYIKAATRKTEVERQESKEKTGVFSGFYVINPATKQEIPVWVADYVLTGYGTGAIMGVPAHDERDWEFAQKFDLPVKQVVAQLFSGVGEVEFRPGEKVVERNVAQCIVWHPTDKKLVVLEVPAYKWNTLVMGGIDDTEDWVEGAKREIREETGYKNVDFISYAGQELWSEFWALHKNENRIAHFRGMQFRLLDLEQDPVAKDEAGKHVIHWLSPQEALAKFKIPEPSYFLEAALSGDSFVPFSGEGKLLNSGGYSGMATSEAREKIVADLEKTGVAQQKTTYRMRDWSVSRQRYWGAPIPVVHCPKCGPQLVPDKDLPVVLPELKDFEPSGDGRSALAKATDWVHTECPKCAGKAERETDTLDTYVDSAWYFLRYLDPLNSNEIFGKAVSDKWMPVDFYNGADHATAHMIYARFVTRFFNKLGLIDHTEPFKKFLFNGKVVGSDGKNFSKTLGNGPDPLDIINEGYGADALRVYLMFAAPVDQWVRWDSQGVPGAYRFLVRLWNLVEEFLEAEASAGSNELVARAVNRTIKKVTADIEAQKYNTAIAAMMQCVNELYAQKADNAFSGKAAWQHALESLVQLVAPFAPHIGEELWQALGHKESVHIDNWPKWDERLIKDELITLAVQINGKLRAEVEVSADATAPQAIQAAKANERVADLIKGKQIKKEIYVSGRLVNLVTE